MASIFGELHKSADSAPNPDFVSVDGSDTNPLGRIGDDWGFWCECWAFWNGGYADEASARTALADHVRELHGELEKMHEAEEMARLHEETGQSIATKLSLPVRSLTCPDFDSFEGKKA